MRKFFSESRLFVVLGLLLLPIVLLGWLFLTQTTKEINFTEKELAGLEYLNAVVPLYARLSDQEQAIAPAYGKALIAVSENADPQMGTHAQSARLLAALAQTNDNRKAAMAAARDLISQVGDNSNLILDPDLDTYYLMDVALLRVPEILDLNMAVKVNAGQYLAAGSTPQYRLQMLPLVGQLTASVTGLERSIERALAGNISGELQAGLAPDIADYIKEANGYIGQIIILSSRLESDPAAANNLMQYSSQFTSRTMQVWHKTNAALAALLDARASKLKRWTTMAIGLSALLTLLAIVLSRTILKQLVNRLDDKIVYLAHHDSMTRLKNRVSFTAEMVSALSSADRTGERMAIHMIDLDRFKAINDSYGHLVGDNVLKTLAQRLLSHSRPSDLVGRLGGDEFVILQRDLKEPDGAEKFAERLVAAMHEAVVVGDQTISCTISIGVALSPLHGSTQEDLVACADMALYAAKGDGRNCFVMFDRALDAVVQKRRSVEREVRRAVSEDRFTLNFQPQFDNSGTHIRGFEALLRLRSVAGENIPPNVFIPIAEQTGLIGPIGAWVLRRACAAAVLWPEHINLAVNLSPVQFTLGGVCTVIQDALKTSGLSSKRLQVEITEGILMENSEAVLAELTAIRALGVSIAMDDFGTGFSSLSYLWRFPFDKIKIDRSFVSALDDDKAGAENILRTIVNLGHSLDMTVTAEGVETNAQADVMSNMKCDEIQGFLYGRPLPEEDLPGVILRAFQNAQLKHSKSEVINSRAQNQIQGI